MATAPEPYIEPQLYLKMEREALTKSEYLDGRVLSMAGASERHNLILSNLIMAVGPLIRSRGCRIYPSDLKIQVGNRFFYPDASIVCGESKYADEEGDVILNPTVLFEILSPTSAAFDRGVKFLSYQNIESLREYVLISQDDMLVEIYRRHRETSWLYTRVQPPDEKLEIESLSIEVGLGDLYDGAA